MTQDQLKMNRISEIKLKCEKLRRWTCERRVPKPHSETVSQTIHKETKHSYIAGGKMVQPLCKIVCQFFKRLNKVIM
jgi:hypothetical protein